MRGSGRVAEEEVLSELALRRMTGIDLCDSSNRLVDFNGANRDTSSGKRSKILPSSSGLYYCSLRVEIKDQKGMWWPAYIVKIEKGKLLVSYEGWDRCWDRWIDCDNDGIRVSNEQRPVPPELLAECGSNPGKEGAAKLPSIRAAQKSLGKKPQKGDPDSPNSPLYACKPRKGLISEIDRRLQDLRQRCGKNMKIVVKEVKRGKFKVSYTTSKGTVVNRWISLGVKPAAKPVLREAPRSPHEGNQRSTPSPESSCRSDRYSLLSAAGIEMRAAANPIARETYQRRMPESAAEK